MRTQYAYSIWCNLSNHESDNMIIFGMVRLENKHIKLLYVQEVLILYSNLLYKLDQDFLGPQYPTQFGAPAVDWGGKACSIWSRKAREFNMLVPPNNTCTLRVELS